MITHKSLVLDYAIIAKGREFKGKVKEKGKVNPVCRESKEGTTPCSFISIFRGDEVIVKTTLRSKS